MCFLRVLDVVRPVITNDVLLLRDEAFSRLRDDVYLKVLASDRRDGEISKSYFYFIVDKLRRMGLLLDNAIAFKVVIPYSVNDRGEVHLRDGILYVTSRKQMVYFDYLSTDFVCDNCPVLSPCVTELKQVAHELGIKIRDASPNLAWFRILRAVQSSLLESSLTLKLKLADIPFGNSVELEKEVEAREPEADV